MKKFPVYVITAFIAALYVGIFVIAVVYAPRPVFPHTTLTASIPLSSTVRITMDTHTEAGVPAKAACSSVYVGEGYFVTAGHCVDRGDSNFLGTFDGHDFSLERITSTEGRSPDWALLRATPLTLPAGLVAAPLGCDSEVRIGDVIYAEGFPRGLPFTVTFGTVVGFNSGQMAMFGSDYLRLDVWTDHGSSGGPIFNYAGEVIGLVSHGPDDALSITYATVIAPVCEYFSPAE